MNYDDEILGEEQGFKIMSDDDSDSDDGDIVEPLGDDFGLDEEDPDHDS